MFFNYPLHNETTIVEHSQKIIFQYKNINKNKKKVRLLLLFVSIPAQNS